MHVHLPKPLHGWRAFVGEVGIIVIGVLIALGAEQVVEELSWRARVHDATDTLRSEIANHYAAATEIVLAAPCIERQLQTLSSGIAVNEPKPAPLYRDDLLNEFVVRAPLRPWSDNQWNAVRDEGVASHFNKDLRDALGDHYAQVEIMRDDNRAARSLESRLTVLAQPITSDPVTRASLSEEIRELLGRIDDMAIVGNQIVGRIQDMGLAPPKAFTADRLAKSGTLTFCRVRGLPLGKIKPEER